MRSLTLLNKSRAAVETNSVWFKEERSPFSGLYNIAKASNSPHTHTQQAVSTMWLAKRGNADLFIVTQKYHSVNLEERPWAEVEICA